MLDSLLVTEHNDIGQKMRFYETSKSRPKEVTRRHDKSDSYFYYATQNETRKSLSYLFSAFAFLFATREKHDLGLLETVQLHQKQTKC